MYMYMMIHVHTCMYNYGVVNCIVVISFYVGRGVDWLVRMSLSEWKDYVTLCVNSEIFGVLCICIIHVVEICHYVHC